MAGEVENQLQGLECLLCFESMPEHKELSCSHTFCEHCLERLNHSHGKKYALLKDELFCPLCGDISELESGGVSELKTISSGQRMKSVIKAAEKVCTICETEVKPVATVFCRTCGEYMCRSCLKAHGKFQKLANHDVVDLDDIKRKEVEGTLFCYHHIFEEKLWVCTTCNQSICSRCITDDHNDSSHKIEKLSEFQKRSKDGIDHLIKEAGERLAAFEKHIKFVKEQEKNMDVKIDEIIADINKAYDESIQHLAARKNELTEQCNGYKNKFKGQLRDFIESSKNEVNRINSSSELVSNGYKTILEGDKLTVHTAISCQLEGKLNKDGPDNIGVMAVTRYVEDLELLRYRGVQELDIGQVMRNTTWGLEKVHTYELSREDVSDLRPTLDRNMAVGYRKGGLDMFTVDGSQKTVLQDVKVKFVSQLSDGRYVVADWDHITIYSTKYEKLPVIFNENRSLSIRGLCTDKCDNIYVSAYQFSFILVFRPEGGKFTKEISWRDPWRISHMNHSKHLIVDEPHITSKKEIKLIDEDGREKGKISDAINAAFPVILWDDSVLVGWEKEYYKLIINLYTSKLLFVRTVLHEFQIIPVLYQEPEIRIEEFMTGEIAVTNKKNLHIFRRF